MKVTRPPTTRPYHYQHPPEAAGWRRTLTALLHDLRRWIRGILRAEFLEEHGAWITTLTDWWPL